MKLAENQRQNIFCLSWKQCLQVYLSHSVTQVVKTAGCGLTCWQMQQFCP